MAELIAGAIPNRMRIDSGPNNDWRNRAGLMTLIVLCGGPYFAYDGWIGWPAQNYAEMERSRPKDAQGEPAQVFAPLFDGVVWQSGAVDRCEGEEPVLRSRFLHQGDAAADH